MIEHDARQHRFVARLPEGEAFLTYTSDEQGTLDFQHTAVPPAARGQGVGEALVRAGLAYAREHGYRVVPSCPYVRLWLAEHPEERDVLAPGAALD